MLESRSERPSRVNRYDVIHVLRETLLHPGHHLVHSSSRINSIGTGQLVYRDDCGGFPVQAAESRVILSAQFDASHVLDAHNTAVRGLPQNDLLEDLGPKQSTLGADRVGVL